MPRRLHPLVLPLALFLAAAACSSSDNSAPVTIFVPQGSSGASGGGAGGSGASGASAGASGAGDTPGSSGSGGQAGGAPESGGSGGVSGSGGCAAVHLPPVLTFELASAPFPGTGHPDVAVHVPDGFLPCERPGLIVFFHGFNNCVTNVIGAADGPCEAGGPDRSALHLVDQLDAARVNAILVAVQLEYDMATGKPGALSNAGSLRALLTELLDAHLGAMLGATLTVDGLDRVVLASHSGGYWALAEALSRGQVDGVREVDLFDSLYGEQPIYEGWIQHNLARFDPLSASETRFVDIYTTGGGTLANSQSLASTVSMELSSAGLSASLLDDPTPGTLAPADYQHPVIIKHSSLAHSDVPRFYFETLAASSGFLPLP